MSRLTTPGAERATCPTCNATGGAHVRAAWPHFVTLECERGKRWCADRFSGAYVCSLDDFENPSRWDVPEPVEAAPIVEQQEMFA